MNAKEMIINSTFDLIKRKSIEKVTVNDILSASGIARSTFYRYFKDKYDVMNWCYKSYVDKLIYQFDGHNWDIKLRQTFEFVNNNGEYFERISRYEGPNSFWSFIHEYTFEFYKDVYQRNTKRKYLTADDRVMLEYTCGGAIGILKYWISNGRAESTEVISQLLYNCLPEQVRELL